MNEKKRLLYEVSYIRPIVIFLLVVTHSIGKIVSGGAMSRDFEIMLPYRLIVELISGFQVQCLALIAGYVFAYQSLELEYKYDFNSFTIKKAKRLIIPMLFFGIIYYLFFFFNADSFSFTHFILKVLSGCGHLWFLSMLFWSFLFVWLVDHYNWVSWKTFILLSFVSMVPMPNLMFGIGNIPHNLIYVYAGYYLWVHRKKVNNLLMSPIKIISLCCMYLLLVCIIHFLNDFYDRTYPLHARVFLLGFTNLIKLLTASCGILVLYLTVSAYTSKKDFTPHTLVLTSSKYCYGVYVYHQFILVYLYFYTPLFDIVNKWLLPWSGLFITLTISIGLTHITLKTKHGKKLIG